MYAESLILLECVLTAKIFLYFCQKLLTLNTHHHPCVATLNSSGARLSSFFAIYTMQLAYFKKKTIINGAHWHHIFLGIFLGLGSEVQNWRWSSSGAH
jgi:hypothetical protein